MNSHWNDNFINWTQLLLLCKKSGTMHTPSASEPYGRLAVRQNTGRFKNSLPLLGFSQPVFNGMVLSSRYFNQFFSKMHYEL